jgi:Domain of Unknown Function (DUF1206)
VGERTLVGEDFGESGAQTPGRWLGAAARAGLVAKGATYGLVGVLAVLLAVGAGGKATSRQGALATLSDESAGGIVIALVAIGLACYALWRLAEGLLGTGEEEGAKEWGARFVSLTRFVIYAVLTYGAVQVLTGSGGGSENEKARESTATVLSWPAGRWIVGTAGLIIIGVGAWNAYEGLAKKFEEEWRTSAMGSTARHWGRRIGVAGHLARAVVFALIGIFIFKAAAEYEPGSAIGLDGALQKLVRADHGPYLLGIVATGLVCFAVFCLLDSRYRDV